MAVSLTKEQEQELFLFQQEKELEAQTQIKVLEEAQRISKGGMTDFEYEKKLEEIRCAVREEYALKQDARDKRRDGIQLAIAIIGAAGGIAAAGATIWSAAQTSKSSVEAAKISANRTYRHIND